MLLGAMILRNTCHFLDDWPTNNKLLLKKFWRLDKVENRNKIEKRENCLRQNKNLKTSWTAFRASLSKFENEKGFFVSYQMMAPSTCFERQNIIYIVNLGIEPSYFSTRDDFPSNDLGDRGSRSLRLAMTWVDVVVRLGKLD